MSTRQSWFRHIRARAALVESCKQRMINSLLSSLINLSYSHRPTKSASGKRRGTTRIPLKLNFGMISAPGLCMHHTFFCNWRDLKITFEIRSRTKADFLKSFRLNYEICVAKCFFCDKSCSITFCSRRCQT